MKLLSGVRNVGMREESSWEVRGREADESSSANMRNNQCLKANFHSCATWNKIRCKPHVGMRRNQSIISGRNKKIETKKKCLNDFCYLVYPALVAFD